MANIINLDETVDLMPDGGEDFVVVPDGTYLSKVTKSEYEKEPKERIFITFEIIDGEHKGARVNNGFYLHKPDCKRISLEQLENLGIPERFHPANAKQLVGKVGNIVTELSEDGKYANVKFVNQKEVPAGTYTAVISKAEKGESFSGKDFIRVVFKIKGGDQNGLCIFDRWFLSEKSIPYTAGKIKRLGVTGNFDADSPSSLRKLVGKKVELTTTMSEGSNGKMYTRVGKMLPYSGSTEEVVEIAVDDSVSVDGEVNVEVSEVAGLAPNDVVVEDEIEEEFPF